jgi:hypothetical protein
VTTVDVVFEERYWYPEDGGEVWLAGYNLVDPGSGRYLGRDAPELAARGLRVAGVAGAGRHHAEALAGVAPGTPLELRRDAANPHDPNAIQVMVEQRLVGYLDRETAARLQPALTAITQRDRARVVVPCRITGGFRLPDGSRAHLGLALLFSPRELEQAGHA